MYHLTEIYAQGENLIHPVHILTQKGGAAKVQSGKWMQKLADCADLSAEPLPGVPIVEIAGDSRVLIEGHDGMTEYSRERICVKVRYGCVCVCGCGLELTRMSQAQLIISGRIDGVQIKRRER